MTTTPRFYNTLTRSVETFSPIEPPVVRMYNCGPTVYDHAHIGNFRAFLFADVLRRYLSLVGHDVHQVMNLTDVGHMTDDQVADGAGQDKMQVAAQRLKAAKKEGHLESGAVADPGDPYQVAGYYIDRFLEDARALGLMIADEYPHRMPRATEHVEAMQAMIRGLITSGHAYVGGDGSVYFSVESFPAYGRLSGNTMEQLRTGAGGRIAAEDQAAKRHPHDFLMWKPDGSHIMRWSSPWGEGYPGWHIECSAMARKVLGRDVIDIHTGGEDNIFPHHECEIAQTCGATGQSHFARCWMHARHLLVEGEKMSKSKGNFYTVRDVLEGRATGRPVSPKVLRYELIKAHYRTNANFSSRGLEDSARAVERIRRFRATLAPAARDGLRDGVMEHPMVSQFTAALADDLNISEAIGALFRWMRTTSVDLEADAGALDAVDAVLGVIVEETPGDAAAEQVEAQCAEIDAARARKDYDTADALRAKLGERGYEVSTTAEGTTARRRLE